MITVVQALAIIMPAVTELVEVIFAPVYDEEAEKAAILRLQNSLNEARLLQYMQENPRK